LSKSEANNRSLESQIRNNQEEIESLSNQVSNYAKDKKRLDAAVAELEDRLRVEEDRSRSLEHTKKRLEEVCGFVICILVIETRIEISVFF
jgi:septal ring factor EnvC (AmiA/AmiB activator)